MRSPVTVMGGIALLLVGLLWTGQGLGYIGGSFMSGSTTWAIIGPVVAVIGVLLIVVGVRGRRGTGRRPPRG